LNLDRRIGSAGRGRQDRQYEIASVH
jgi:hypothetical protein